MTMKLARSRRWLLAALLTLGLAIPFIGLETKGGKPVPPPEPPSVPVRYQLKTFGMPEDSYGLGGNMNVYQMSSSGLAVGDYADLNLTMRGFLYDPSIDPDNAVNLNDLGIVGIPDGWYIRAATDINDLGFVVGSMESQETPGLHRGFLLDLSSDPPSLISLPVGDLYTYCRRINDSMDILGVYRNADGTWGGYIYNPLVGYNDLEISLLDPYVHLSNPVPGAAVKIVGKLADGSPFRKTIGGALETFADLSYIRDINGAGDFCGNQEIRTRRKVTYTAIRYRSEVELFDGYGHANAINNHGNLVLDAIQFYHEGTGTVSLDNIVDGSNADLAAWFAGNPRVTDMTERGAINSEAPDFPGLSGTITSFDFAGRGFVAIPVPEPEL